MPVEKPQASAPAGVLGAAMAALKAPADFAGRVTAPARAALSGPLGLAGSAGGLTGPARAALSGPLDLASMAGPVGLAGTTDLARAVSAASPAPPRLRPGPVVQGPSNAVLGVPGPLGRRGGPTGGVDTGPGASVPFKTDPAVDVSGGMTGGMSGGPSGMSGDVDIGRGPGPAPPRPTPAVGVGGDMSGGVGASPVPGVAKPGPGESWQAWVKHYRVPLALAGIGTAAGAYALYRWMSGGDEEEDYRRRVRKRAAELGRELGRKMARARGLPKWV